jgi:hypothetical protein
MEVGLDGRLLRFRAQPSASETPKDATAIPDWSVCFNAAHLDVATFAPVEPQPGGIEPADIRAAWTGTYPGHADLPIRWKPPSADGLCISRSCSRGHHRTVVPPIPRRYQAQGGPVGC